MTGWLQIQGVRVTDEGTYRCFARNRVGAVVAVASLTVLTPGEQREGGFGQGTGLQGWQRHRLPVLLFQTNST